VVDTDVDLEGQKENLEMQYVTTALNQVHIVTEAVVEGDDFQWKGETLAYGHADTSCGRTIWWVGRDLLTDEAADPTFKPCQACIDEADRKFRESIDLIAKAMGR
jgi:hypothetical protein